MRRPCPCCESLPAARGRIERGRVGNVGRRRVGVASEDASASVAAAASLPAEDLEDLCSGAEAVAVRAVKVLIRLRGERERERDGER